MSVKNTFQTNISNLSSQFSELSPAKRLDSHHSFHVPRTLSEAGKYLQYYLHLICLPVGRSLIFVMLHDLLKYMRILLKVVTTSNLVERAAMCSMVINLREQVRALPWFSRAPPGTESLILRFVCHWNSSDFLIFFHVAYGWTPPWIPDSQSSIWQAPSEYHPNFSRRRSSSSDRKYPLKDHRHEFKRPTHCFWHGVVDWRQLSDCIIEILLEFTTWDSSSWPEQKHWNLFLPLATLFSPVSPTPATGMEAMAICQRAPPAHSQPLQMLSGNNNNQQSSQILRPIVKVLPAASGSENITMIH